MKKNELLMAVRYLAAEKNLSQRVVVAAIESALESAYRSAPKALGKDVQVRINPETGEVDMALIKRVVEDGQADYADAEIPISEALAEGHKDAEVGSTIRVGSLDYNRGRVAAQATRQVIDQRLREAQRDVLFDEFSDKSGQLLVGKIHKVEKRTVWVDLGDGIAIMPPLEQSDSDRYRQSQQLKVYLVKIERTPAGPEIIVSRSHPDLLRRLFESEVPEIANGSVEIKAIAREPGSRSKVAVFASNNTVDAVGACVGLRGIRIQSIVSELVGEKIDVVEWSEELPRFIANSLSPASVEKVTIDPESNVAQVIVPTPQFSLAIGRDGQNVRLASKLTNCAIEIQGAREAPSEAKSTQETAEQKGPERQIEAKAEVQATAETEVEAQPVESFATEKEIKTVTTEPVEVLPEEPAEKVPVAKETSTPAEDTSESEKAEEERRIRENEEIRALEKELAELERQEEERRKVEDEDKKKATNVSGNSIWDVDFLTQASDGGTTELRFAEDIADLRGAHDDTKSRRSRGEARKKGRR